MKIFETFKNLFGMKKKSDIEKMQYRGTLKQIMKERGLRSISLANYNAYKKAEPTCGVHSLKIDIQDGYLNLYNYPTIPKPQAGSVMDNVPTDVYKAVYNRVQDILSEENSIPYKVRKNILVGMSR